MASVQGQYVVQATKTATPAIQNATTKIPPFSSSHSVSSNYTSAFLNLKNLQSTEAELVYMMNINVQHEVLHTSPLLTIPHSFQKIKSKILNAVKEYLGTSLDDALYKVLKKHDADIIKEFSVPTAIKRKPDDADKDEGPSAGSNRGLKRQRTSKGTKTSKKMPTSKDSSKGKSPSSSLKSSKSGKSAKDQVEKPIFVQDYDYAKHDDVEFDNTDMPMDQGKYLVKTDEQPNDEDVPKYDWYKKSRSDTSPDSEWNEGKLFDDGLEQSWLNDMAKAT
ncbi:hypothetical protein Tco_0875926 [Tanacetum coccineum]|uniref:Uncharacterized protein n=1 Tax=Tanacetum coccineum TaxID=301880 RepID=A0ABQ5BQW0_9ASTR